MASSRIDDLRKRLEKEPGSRLFAQLAEELRKEGELSEAIRVCRDGLARSPNYPSARMTLARALMDSGDLSAARSEFEAVLKGAPDNILASRLLGECLEALGDTEGALARYRATLALAPADKLAQARERELSRRVAKPPTVAAPLWEPAPQEEPPDERAAAPAGPIRVVEAAEEFELEAAYEAPVAHWVAGSAPAVEPSSAPEGETVEAPMPGEGEPEGPPPPGTEPLASATLAELYLSQGLTDRAIGMYRRVAEREPGNETVRARLAELEAAPREPEGEAQPPDISAPAADAETRRRAAIQRRISRLESLLSAINKRSSG